eukprot:346204_1
MHPCWAIWGRFIRKRHGVFQGEMFVGPAFDLSYVVGHPKAQKNLYQSIHLARLGILRLWIMDCSEMEVVKRFTRNNSRCAEKHMDRFLADGTPNHNPHPCDDATNTTQSDATNTTQSNDLADNDVWKYENLKRVCSLEEFNEQFKDLKRIGCGGEGTIYTERSGLFGIKHIPFDPSTLRQCQEEQMVLFTTRISTLY